VTTAQPHPVVAPAPGQLPASLLWGVDAAACGVLGVRSLRHRSAALELCSRQTLKSGSVRAVYDVIAANWRCCRTARPVSGSVENWRWRTPKLDIAARNTSPEVMLERAIVAACERKGRTDWSNQVPVASGIAGAFGERRRAIDLVREVGPGSFEFVELKIASDTPLYAAFEIIGYVCIWLLSRCDPRALPSPILKARRIAAKVLAPNSYYTRYALGPLERQLDYELSALGEAFGVDLGLAFEAFEDELGRSPFTDRRLAELLSGRRSLEA
jgi:hypothetical protein